AFPRRSAMSADFRYMKCPRQTWFLVYTIPPDLRSHPRFTTANGRPMDKITESLGTKDPDKAREIRNQRIVYWDRQFRMLQHGPSDEDIREEAIEVYRKALEDQAELEKAEKPSDKELEAQYLSDLWEAIDSTVVNEVHDYCERVGIPFEHGTPLFY